MSAHRHQATWRSITFNQRYLDAGLAPDDVANINPTYAENDYFLDAMDPTPLNITDLREARQFLEGAEPNQAFEGSRLLNIHGRVVAPDHGTLEDMTWALYEAFSPAACRLAFAYNDPPNVGPFLFKRDTAGGGVLSLQAYARPAVGRPVVFGRRGEGTTRQFLARLIAYDPKFYSQTLASQALASLVGGNNNVNNVGNLFTDPKFVFVLSGAGSATVTLTNSTTSHAMIFDFSGLGAGTYTLDVNRAIFTKSDGTNVMTTRKIPNGGFPVNMWLAPGNNVITLTGNTNLTSVTVQWRPAYA